MIPFYVQQAFRFNIPSLQIDIFFVTAVWERFVAGTLFVALRPSVGSCRVSWWSWRCEIGSEFGWWKEMKRRVNKWWNEASNGDFYGKVCDLLILLCKNDDCYGIWRGFVEMIYWVIFGNQRWFDRIEAPSNGFEGFTVSPTPPVRCQVSAMDGDYCWIDMIQSQSWATSGVAM